LSRRLYFKFERLAVQRNRFTRRLDDLLFQDGRVNVHEKAFAAYVKAVIKNKQEIKFMADTKKAVLVTTEFRGVFFGFIKNDKNAPAEITLTDARNCLSWSSDVGGFLGLASKGVTNNCRIGSKVDELTLYKITSITPVSESAVKTWEKA